MSSTFTPSAFQQAIYNFVENGTGSAVVIAVAGSGKTTTIVNAANLIPERAVASFVAFNKAIAVELGERLPKHVRSQTLNAMGFAAWSRACQGGPRLFVDGSKVSKIVEKVLPEGKRISGSVTRLVSLAKSVGIVTVAGYHGLTEDTDYNWLELVNQYDLMASVDEKEDPLDAIRYARLALTESIQSARRVIDFDDQLYMPVISRSSFFKNDYLFVDEAQDVNMVQRAMLRMALKPAGRLIAVGDPYQAIYGFRGADQNAIENLKADFSAIELPLSISYRCPRAVVELAQQFVPHIQAAPTAVEGTINHPAKYSVAQFNPQDVVICRTTAPLIALAYKMIRARKACYVMGREIGQGLVGVITKLNAKGIDNLQDKLRTYEDREVARFTKAKQEARADAVRDRVATIELFIEELPETDRTIPALCNSISSLFSDNMQAQAVKLMTQHKSKGLEAADVFILDWELNEKFMDKGGAGSQEPNIAYVAITRSKRTLTFVDSKMFR